MFHRVKFCGALMLLTPLVTDPRAVRDGASETNIGVAGSYGSHAYVNRGCEGEVLHARRVNFGGYGASVDHKFRQPVRIGLRGGFLPATGGRATNGYLNPHVALEWRRLSLGAGAVAARYDSLGTWKFPKMSFQLRVAPLDRAYFSVSLCDNVPLYAGGGLGQIGFGAQPHSRLEFWAGASSRGPYDTWGGLLALDYNVRPNLSTTLYGRVGKANGTDIGENSIGLGPRKSRTV